MGYGGVTMESNRLKGVLIGAGNLAWSLAQALEKYVDFSQVYSHTPEHAADLAAIIGAEPVVDLKAIDTTAQIYIIAVADHSLPDVVEALPPVPDAIWAHTSGGIDMDVLGRLGRNIGVFYPLQTFSRGKTVDMSHVPFFIEASNAATETALMHLAGKLSDNVNRADSRVRSTLHIAGVLTCNFVNSLWSTASKLLAADGLDMNAVWPLIEETLAKAKARGPENSQTGPARRADYDVMRMHMSKLPPEDAEIYRLMSNKILNSYYDEPNQL